MMPRRGLGQSGESRTLLSPMTAFSSKVATPSHQSLPTSQGSVLRKHKPTHIIGRNEPSSACLQCNLNYSRPLITPKRG